MQHTSTTRHRLSESRAGARNPFHGKRHSAATKKRMARIARPKDSSGRLTIGPRTIWSPPSQSLDRGYLVGLLDGEGSVRFRRGRPFVAIYNTDRRIIDWLLAHVGGKIGTVDRRGRKPCYAWELVGARDVWSFCLNVRDHVLAKREDVDAAIAALEAKYGVEVLRG